ncbi:hypothetical protein E2C01_074362 [Portunus trituberculatus]|uniref:Uncharacterized protein n=1 Tax=Portunus trituberculatus TaxID=210409 RepID=A0A5B7ID11_PORTR|nr:hypothetical protein [Portunus trituberculatus]
MAPPVCHCAVHLSRGEESREGWCSIVKEQTTPHHATPRHTTHTTHHAPHRLLYTTLCCSKLNQTLPPDGAPSRSSQQQGSGQARDSHRRRRLHPCFAGVERRWRSRSVIPDGHPEGVAAGRDAISLIVSRRRPGGSSKTAWPAIGHRSSGLYGPMAAHRSLIPHPFNVISSCSPPTFLSHNP